MENKKTFTNSSQVSQINYVPDEKIMGVTFLTGKRYQYFDVPKEVFERAKSAESIGKFLNSEVKNKYEYRQI